MGLFWKRKSGDQFVSLNLNRPTPVETAEVLAEGVPEKTAGKVIENEKDAASPTPIRAQQTISSTSPAAVAPAPVLEPVPAGAGPTPVPSEPLTAKTQATELHSQSSVAARPAAPPQKPISSRTPFATSVLGLNLSMEELQAQEAALEQEFSARFKRAVAATRESLSERLDTVFQGLKQIDENLLDELEEALIAADIGVPTTQHILETVRRGVARKQINDLDTLKRAIKDELLKILRQSEKQGVASETSVPENVSPYVMMIVGVNGVGKTTTIGKLAQRIKAEGNDVLICAADTFRYGRFGSTCDLGRAHRRSLDSTETGDRSRGCAFRFVESGEGAGLGCADS